MNTSQKLVLASMSMICGLGLIGWNLRDKDRAYRELPQEERQTTIQELPATVQATVKRLSAGGAIEEIKEERRGSEVKYEVEIIQGDTKTDYEIAPDGSILEQKSKKLK